MDEADILQRDCPCLPDRTQTLGIALQPKREEETHILCHHHDEIWAHSCLVVKTPRDKDDTTQLGIGLFLEINMLEGILCPSIMGGRFSNNLEHKSPVAVCG